MIDVVSCMCIYNSGDSLVNIDTFEGREVSSNPAGWIAAAFRPPDTSVHNIRLGRMQIRYA